MTNIVDPEEMARYEPSHLALHSLYRYLSWSIGLKGLNIRCAIWKNATSDMCAEDQAYLSFRLCTCPKVQLNKRQIYIFILLPENKVL